MPEMNLQMRQMWTLVKREFQEYRTIFLFLPFGFALLVVSGFSYGLYRLQAEGLPLFTFGPREYVPPSMDDQVLGLAGSAFTQSISVLMEMPMAVRAMAINGSLNALAPALWIAYWGSMFFYFVLTLYQTRKDRSILFYNSMPVSDRQIVLSKLSAGMLAVPVVYLAAMLLMQLLLLIVVSGFGLAAGLGSGIFPAFWQPASPVVNVLSMLVLLPLGLLWTLPVYGALLLGSAWARNAPFAWVAALPLAVIVTEYIANDSSRALALILRHSIPFWHFQGGPVAQELGARIMAVMNAEMGVSILLGSAFVWAAIRFNRSEDC
jgi:hypothetical protein